MDVLADTVPVLLHGGPALAPGALGAYPCPAPRPRAERELDEQREYVDSLERRVAELEERLDFTERLLAQRNQGAPEHRMMASP